MCNLLQGDTSANAVLRPRFAHRSGAADPRRHLLSVLRQGPGGALQAAGRATASAAGRRKATRTPRASSSDGRRKAARCVSFSESGLDRAGQFYSTQCTTIIFSRSFAPPARELTRAGAVTLSRRSLEACGKRKTSALLVRVSTVYYPLLKSPPVAVPLSCFRRHSVGSNAH